jgi:hypothetical protein
LYIYVTVKEWFGLSAIMVIEVYLLLKID